MSSPITLLIVCELRGEEVVLPQVSTLQSMDYWSSVLAIEQKGIEDASLHVLFRYASVMTLIIIHYCNAFD